MSRLVFEKEENGRTRQLYGRGDGDPELYMDGAWGLSIVNGVVKTNLFTNAPGENRQEIVARLVMPLPILFAFAEFLGGQCQRLIDEGLVEAAETPESEGATARSEKGPSAPSKRAKKK